MWVGASFSVKPWHLHRSLQLVFLFDSIPSNFSAVYALLPHLSTQSLKFSQRVSYLPVLALLYLLISYTLADGRHTQPDVIGCPTMMTLDVMNRAVTDFCALNFQTSDASPTKAIAVGPSWPGLDYSAQIYQDNWGNFVSLWANFRVDRTSNREPYLLNSELCISLLERAGIGNGTELHGDMKDCANTTGNGLTYGGWGNTDFGTVFAEPICPSGVHCLPDRQRPRGCSVLRKTFLFVQ